MDSALEKLASTLREVPWEGEIVGAQAPDKAFVGAGEDLGVRVGTRFGVVHRGAPIVGPDGSVLGFDESAGGTVEVTSVQPKMSIVKLLNGDLPKIGDRVRFQPPTESASAQRSPRG